MNIGGIRKRFWLPALNVVGALLRRTLVQFFFHAALLMYPGNIASQSAR